MDLITDFGMITAAVMVAVIVGLEQIGKNLGLNAKFIPLLNLALGLMLCIVFIDGDMKLRVFNGLMVGLSASGLYSGVKNVKQGLE